MNRNTLLILFAGSLLLTVFALWLNRPAEEQTSELLLPGLDPALITEVQLHTAGNRQVAVLNRVVGNTDWVEGHTGYRANSRRISELLQALTAAAKAEPKTRDQSYYDRLGLSAIEQPDAGGIAISLYAGNDIQGAVIAGDRIDGQQYARLRNDDRSWLLDRELTSARQQLDWLDQSLLDVPANRLARIELQYDDGAVYVFNRDETASGGFTGDNYRLNRPAGSFLAALRLESVHPAGHADSLVTARFTTVDGLAVTATVSANQDGYPVQFFAEHLAVDPADGNLPDPAAVAAEAAAINERLGGWSYTLPAFKTELLLEKPATLDAE